MTLGNGSNFCNFSCDDIIIKNSLSEKTLGLTVDNNLDFSDRICNICKAANQKLNSLLRLMTNNYELSYWELLDLTNEVFPHQRCLNSLMTEACKCLNGLSPDVMNEILAVSKHRYNTRHYNLFVTDRPKSDRYGRNSIPYIRYGIPCISNGLVVRALDSQSRGPVFKTTGWLQGRLSLSSFRGR